MTKRKTVLYLRPETATGLAEYQRRHRVRFASASAAADHLLARALTAAVDEGAEGLLVPDIQRAVRETTRREIEEQVLPLIERQTERLAGLLVRSGKDAAGAFGVGAVILERVLGDAVRAREIAADVRLRAGAQYARGTKPPGMEVTP